MSSVQIALIALLSIFVTCQCLPRPWGAPPGGAARLAFDNSGSSLCRVICSRKDVVCPPECAFTNLDFNKRSYRVNRARSFGDIRYGNRKLVDETNCTADTRKQVYTDILYLFREPNN